METTTDLHPFRPSSDCDKSANTLEPQGTTCTCGLKINEGEYSRSPLRKPSQHPLSAIDQGPSLSDAVAEDFVRIGTSVNVPSQVCSLRALLSSLPPKGKGMHLVTDVVLRECQEGLRNVDIGILTLCSQHTSAGLTVNENCDPSVRTDMDMALDTIVPESLPWEHTDEGPDDSVSHLKTSLIGNSVTIPITKGKLQMGTWGGIYLAEFRKSGHGWGGQGSGRRVVATILP